MVTYRVVLTRADGETRTLAHTETRLAWAETRAVTLAGSVVTGWGTVTLARVERIDTGETVAEYRKETNR
jgi:hypothetical protein